MSLVTHLTPLNLQTEKKLFDENSEYNPQFSYSQEFTSEKLSHWGKPQPEITAFAIKLLKERPSLTLNRVEFNPEIVRTLCENVLKRTKVTEEISIIFDPQKLTRCSVKGKQITFRLPPEFSDKEELEATLNHELQTHLLRNLNQLKQGWSIDREKVDKLLLRTEEGLAVLHGLLASNDKTVWRPAAYYVAVSYAQEHSFSQCVKKLIQLGFESDYAWRLTVRTKRGLGDTSQKGGNTKDLCYLEGAIKIWQWLQDESHQPQDLYLGKIYIEELEQRKKMVKTNSIYVPTFMENSDLYRAQINTIGVENNFDQITSLDQSNG